MCPEGQNSSKLVRDKKDEIKIERHKWRNLNYLRTK